MTSGEVEKLTQGHWLPLVYCQTLTRKILKLADRKVKMACRRPHTRGVVMNPVDHPTVVVKVISWWKASCIRTGQSAKGLKTRDNKRTDKFIIRRRKKKGDK